MNLLLLNKTKQNRKLSKTWRTMQVAREIEKNNFHITGDLGRAREFGRAVTNYEMQPGLIETMVEPITIYSAI